MVATANPSNMGFLAVKEALEGGPDEAQSFVDKWTEQVMTTVPKDKLLVFDIKEGWEPLCKFLNKEVPNKPFPRSNDSKQFQNRTRSTRIKGYLFIFLTPMILTWVSYYVCKFIFGSA